MSRHEFVSYCLDNKTSQAIDVIKKWNIPKIDFY